MLNTFNSRVLIALFFSFCSSTIYSAEAADAELENTIEKRSVAEDVIEHDANPIPTRLDALSLTELGPDLPDLLYGIRNTQYFEFTLRRDQVVTDATLNLVVTPSPALLPKVSHLRVYLNDALMGVVPLEGSELEFPLRRAVSLDPTMMATFNRVALEFVGHYTDICEDLANTSLWLDIGHQTNIEINQQSLPIANDLSYFPEPFFDAGDTRPQTIPFVFSTAPNEDKIQAASILASYFGVQAKWRKLSFPTSYDRLPAGHAVVFATNADRPEFLSTYPAVDSPTVDMISAPGNPYEKLLLILGRDDADLVLAASALAANTPLLRGQSVTVSDFSELQPRMPYDAPNWVPTDRPVQFSELVDYPGQLQISGLRPLPINLNINLPPDLFVWRNSGIPTQVRYRYTPLEKNDGSRLTINLNDQFVDSYLLQAGSSDGKLTKMRLPVIGNETQGTRRSLFIPALKVGTNNRMSFEFSFATTLGSAQRDECRTLLPVDVRAAVDETSSIDLSGFHHYLDMPNLRAFAGGGFPFSRMADLSETLVVIPSQPTSQQVSTLLELMASLGAQIGFPALKVQITHSWDTAKDKDADILLIGDFPNELRARPDANLLMEETISSLRQPRSTEHGDILTNYRTADLRPSSDRRTAEFQVGLRSAAPIAAIVGMQSDYYPQRSVVGVLAASEDEYILLRDALNDPGKRQVMNGSVVIIRESGVASFHVGDTYFVGHIPWWNRVWYQLSGSPVMLAAVAVFTVLLAAFLLWTVLRWISRRRLERDA